MTRDNALIKKISSSTKCLYVHLQPIPRVVSTRGNAERSKASPKKCARLMDGWSGCTLSMFSLQIPHLVSLGINAVELLPVFEYDELEFQRFKNPRDHMVNIWGYSHLNFFAPMSRFAANGEGPTGAARQFKDMVAASVVSWDSSFGTDGCVCYPDSTKPGSKSFSMSSTTTQLNRMTRQPIPFLSGPSVSGFRSQSLVPRVYECMVLAGGLIPECIT